MNSTIIIYETANNEVPLLDFVSTLPEKLRAKVLNDIDILEEFGNELREPHTKHLEGDIFELRTRQGTNNVRTLFFFYYNKQIVITHGFLKKTNNTPPAEIERAEKYRIDWIERNSNGLQRVQEGNTKK